MKLLPCPWCGSTDPEADEQKFPYEGGVKIKQSICCLDCFAQGPMANNESDATLLWNTRTPPPTVWHRAGKRLPKEKDGDFAGSVWACVNGEPVQRVPFFLVIVWQRECRRNVLWTHTNFIMPEAPKV